MLGNAAGIREVQAALEHATLANTYVYLRATPGRAKGTMDGRNRKLETGTRRA
jgi:hypothetical protein